MQLVKVLIEYGSSRLDKTFDYCIQEPIKKYSRVKVTFNRRSVIGFVLQVSEIDLEAYEKEVGYKIQSIDEIIDDQPILNQEMYELACMMSKKYLCSLVTCIQVMLPKALKPKTYKTVTIQYKATYYPLEVKDKLTPKQLLAYQTILSNPGIDQEQLEFSQSIIKQLLSKEAIKVVKVEVYRQATKHYQATSLNELTIDQEAVMKAINDDENNVHLIEGVTGSGKTEVYLHLTKQMVEKDKAVLMLLPEIALTPMMIERFKRIFGSMVAVLHSRLSDGQRYDEYRRIQSKEALIVIGARSAIFAPCIEIGLIIIDEEHDASYQQSTNPMYETIELAKKRASTHHALLVLGSATPSLKTYHQAELGLISHHHLRSRFNQQAMPKMTLIDLKKQVKQGTEKLFSQELINAIQLRIDKQEQVMLLLNRRGFAPFVSCQSCGETIKCPHCDVSLTYHRNHQLICHYCGFQQPSPSSCPNCQQETLQHLGVGTQQVQQQLERLFVGARIARIDRDSTTKKDSYEKWFKGIENKEYDIIIGTQMIAKGLDFKDVTLVGVLNADLSLHFPDFDASERTFQLLTQVAGRSGRHEKKGEVIIQAYDTDHPIINLALKQDYQAFYQEEMMIRQVNHYPPYYYMMELLLSSKDENYLNNHSIEVLKYLKQYQKDFELLGPTVPSIAKLNDQFRMMFTIKYRRVKEVYPLFNALHQRYNQGQDSKLKIQFYVK